MLHWKDRLRQAGAEFIPLASTRLRHYCLALSCLSTFTPRLYCAGSIPLCGWPRLCGWPLLCAWCPLSLFLVRMPCSMQAAACSCSHPQSPARAQARIGKAVHTWETSQLRLLRHTIMRRALTSSFESNEHCLNSLLSKRAYVCRFSVHIELSSTLVTCEPGRWLDAAAYTLGWICALPIELTAAAQAMLEEHLPHHGVKPVRTRWAASVTTTSYWHACQLVRLASALLRSARGRPTPSSRRFALD